MVSAWPRVAAYHTYILLVIAYTKIFYTYNILYTRSTYFIHFNNIFLFFIKLWIQNLQGNVTSVLRHFRPIPFYATSDLRYFGPTTVVGLMHILFCLSDLRRNCRYCQYVVATIRIDVPVAHVGRMHTFVGWMHNFHRSDAQL